MSEATEAFQAAGLDLSDLERKRRDLAAASAQEKTPSVAAMIPEPAPYPKCRSCNSTLAVDDGWFCKLCQARMDAERAKRDATYRNSAVADAWHEDWPLRHRDRVAEFDGPALERAGSLYPTLLKGAMFLLYGAPGTGKTGMAVSWESWRLNDGRPPGRFMTAQDFFSLVKSSWSDNSETALIRDLRKLRYLVIDEIDERSASDWENRTLFNLLNHRYNDERATVLISNLDKAGLVGAYPQKFLDRIAEAGGMVHCNWPTYRK